MEKNSKINFIKYLLGDVSFFYRKLMIIKNEIGFNLRSKNYLDLLKIHHREEEFLPYEKNMK